MGSELKSKPVVVKCTMNLAKRFAEMEPAPHDRNLNEKRVSVYVGISERDEWRPLTWAETHCLETDTTYRVNGKHTSTAIVRHGQVPKSLYITVESYQSDTLEDVARLYSTFDTKLQSRNTNDINKSFAASVPALAGIPVRTISAGVHGIAYCDLQDSYTTRQPADRAEAIIQEPDFFVWLHEHFSTDVDGRCPRHILRGPIVAAMFGSYKKSKSDAEAFWLDVVNESNKDAKSPSRTLGRFLRSTAISCGRGADKAKTVRTKHVFIKCIHAWNAHRRGDTTDLKVYSDAKIPVFK